MHENEEEEKKKKNYGLLHLYKFSSILIPSLRCLLANTKSLVLQDEGFPF